jgi:DNA-binding CsgD family transcriptional regulator
MTRYQNLQRFFELIRNFQFDPELTNYKESLLQSTEVNKFTTLGNQFFLIFDISSCKIIKISDNIKDIMGWDNENLTLQFIYNQIVAEDRNIVINASEYALEVCIEHPEIRIFDSTFDVDFRIMKSDGNIVRLLSKTCILMKDKMGFPVLLLSLFTDLSQFKINNFIDVAAEGPDKHLFNYIKNYSIKPDNGIYTEKEIQILKKLADGKCCKIIADEMNIKLCTVNSHCINMLRKSNQNKMNGVLALAINNGYLK